MTNQVSEVWDMSDYLERIKRSLPQRTPQCPKCGAELHTTSEGNERGCLVCAMRATLRTVGALERAALLNMATAAIERLKDQT